MRMRENAPESCSADEARVVPAQFPSASRCGEPATASRPRALRVRTGIKAGMGDDPHGAFDGGSIN